MVITSAFDIVGGRFDGLPIRKGWLVLSKFAQNSSTIQKISVILSKQITR
jgi:hypothetical protein|nr:MULTISPECIES: hypothetical protein [unclassified Flavobacterium]